MSARIAAILGAGPVGAGWAARFALMGWQVQVFDPDPGAEMRIADSLSRARASLPALYDTVLPPEGEIRFCTTLSAAAAGAVWIQDSTPDRLELKRKLIQKLQEVCDPSAVIACSSDAFTLGELQGCATRPAQILRATPTRPCYLLPPVSLPDRDRVAEALIPLVEDILPAIGMVPLWGMAAEAGGPLAPGLDDDTRVTLLRGLKDRRSGLGTALALHDIALRPAAPAPDQPAALTTSIRQVPVTWVDYNGHMNDAFYLTAFSQACDQMLRWAGMDTDEVADGHSVFTVETHIRYLEEVNIGDTIRVDMRVIEGGGKKLHIWQELFVQDRLCATAEQLMLHVDLTTRRSAPPRPDVGVWLGRVKAAQATLPLPEGFGRHVAQRG